MNGQEKSLALAVLMGWELVSTQGNHWINNWGYTASHSVDCYLDPYNNLAQFAAILLKFPEVMGRRVAHPTIDPDRGMSVSLWTIVEPTQENILDEIIKMNGKWIES